MEDYFYYLDEFIEQTGVNFPVVVGQSFGSRLAIHCVLKNADDVELLVIGNPAIYVLRSRRIDVKTIICWGNTDPLVPKRFGKKIHNMIKGLSFYNFGRSHPGMYRQGEKTLHLTNKYHAHKSVIGQYVEVGKGL